MHDDSIPGRQHHVLLPVRRLQGRPRVHRRLHLHVDAIQGDQPNTKRGTVPQIDRRLGLILHSEQISNFICIYVYLTFQLYIFKFYSKAKICCYFKRRQRGTRKVHRFVKSTFQFECIKKHNEWPNSSVNSL